MRPAVFVLIAALCAAQTPHPDIAAKADAVVKSYVRDGIFRGAVLVAKDGQVLFERGYGNANDEWQIPNTVDTRFRLGSITKQFTAAAILKLIEQGKVSLDDPMKKFYPEAPAAWDAITIRHLLNHTSGIPSYTGLPGFMQKRARERMTPIEIVNLSKDLPLEFQPGEKYAYNNTGYVFLGYVIEKVSGESYAAHVKRVLFDPLGMKNSGYDTADAIIPKRASGYTSRGQHAAYLDMSLPHAAGSLYSTAGDLLIWDQALHGGKVVSADSYRMMTTPGKGNYGFGLVMMKGKRESIGHGGGIFGFNTMLHRYPAEKITAVVLANMETPATGPMAIGLADLAAGDDVQPRAARVEVSVAPDKLDRLVGDFELRPGFVMTVFREGDKLMTRATGQGAIQIFPMSETKFFPKVVDAEIEFHLGGDGKPEALSLKQNGMNMRAPRKAAQ